MYLDEVSMLAQRIAREHDRAVFRSEAAARVLAGDPTCSKCAVMAARTRQDAEQWGKALSAVRLLLIALTHI